MKDKPKIILSTTDNVWIGEPVYFSEEMKVNVCAGDILVRKAKPLNKEIIISNKINIDK